MTGKKTVYCYTVYPEVEMFEVSCDDPPYDTLLSKCIKVICELYTSIGTERRDKFLELSVKSPVEVFARNAQAILIGAQAILTNYKEDVWAVYSLQYSVRFDKKSRKREFVPLMVIYCIADRNIIEAEFTHQVRQSMERDATVFYGKYIEHEKKYRELHNVWHFHRFAGVPLEMFMREDEHNPELKRQHIETVKDHLVDNPGTRPESLTILSFNVQTYETALADIQTADEKLRKLADIIERGNTDVVALQEDLSPTPTTFIVPSYERVVVSYAEQYLPENRFMVNSWLVKKDKEQNLSTVLHNRDVAKIQITEKSRTPRSAACIEFNTGTRNIILCNVHINGGRWDDKDFRTTLHQKEDQLKGLLRRILPDIIVGDFNGGPDRVRADHDLKSLPLYKDLSDYEKTLYLDYHVMAHALLREYDYVPAYSEPEVKKTSKYGVVTDWVYVHRSLPVTDVKVEVIDALDVSDHNAVKVTLQFLPREDAGGEELYAQFQPIGEPRQKIFRREPQSVTDPERIRKLNAHFGLDRPKRNIPQEKTQQVTDPEELREINGIAVQLVSNQ